MIYTTLALAFLVAGFGWWIIRGQNNIMAAIEDLKAAVTRLNISTSTELKAIADKLAAEDPDVEAAATALNTLSDNLDTETKALTS